LVIFEMASNFENKIWCQVFCLTAPDALFWKTWAPHYSTSWPHQCSKLIDLTSHLWKRGSDYDTKQREQWKSYERLISRTHPRKVCTLFRLSVGQLLDEDRRCSFSKATKDTARNAAPSWCSNGLHRNWDRFQNSEPTNARNAAT
jgi:hypothetical protein